MHRLHFSLAPGAILNEHAGSEQPARLKLPRITTYRRIPFEHTSHLEVRVDDTEDEYFIISLWVDGKQFGDAAVDLLELKRSALGPGGFYLITCGCGNAGCAGIFEPIFVQHSKLAVTWECNSRYYPLVQQGDDSHARILRYTFSRAQYVGAIRSAFEQLRDHPRRHSVSIGPEGFDVDMLDEPFPDASEPVLPFDRGATLIVGYAGPYSQPWVWVDGRPEEPSRKLLPTAQLWGDFGRWAAMWEASIEYGLCVWKKDGQPFLLSEHATLEDSNRHARALAESLAHFWTGAAKIAWEELIADGRTGEDRPAKVIRTLG